MWIVWYLDNHNALNHDQIFIYIPSAVVGVEVEALKVRVGTSTVNMSSGDGTAKLMVVFSYRLDVVSYCNIFVQPRKFI